MQPGAHDILATGVDGSNLGDGEAAVGEQDQVGQPRHSTDRLPTDNAQFVSLALGQMHVKHTPSLLLSQAAKFMPNFLLCA
jgi:hypothetical protein